MKLVPTNKSSYFFTSSVFISLLIIIFSTEAAIDMFGIFKKYDVHLSPEVHGRIVLKGKPVEGIEVYRGLTYGDDDELVDKTITNSNGEFSFVEKNIRSRRPGSMFDESSIRQTIDVNYKGKQFLLWYTEAIGIEPNQALTERLHELNCDLADPQEESEFSSYEYPHAGYLVHSICRW